MQIGQQQYEVLERCHGKDMVIVLSVGDDDFVFRRPTEAEITYALGCEAKKMPNFLEELALGCLVCAGTAVESTEVIDALGRERARLSALWDAGQVYRDSVAYQFAASCGWGLLLDSKNIGGGRYELSLVTKPEAQKLGIELSITVTAAKPNRDVYDRFKQLEIGEDDGDAERYIWDALVDSPNKAEVSRLYPFAVIATGGFLPTLGADKGSVRVKKFSSGPVLVPGNSTVPQAKES